VGRTSEMHGPLRVRECRAGLFDEETPCIGEFHNPSLVASEQVKLMLGFEVGNLFAERRLGYMQSVRGPPEVQLFGQGNDSKQVSISTLGNTAPSPVHELGDTRCFVLPFVCVATSG
jgi:hypothetical protein